MLLSMQYSRNCIVLRIPAACLAKSSSDHVASWTRVKQPFSHSSLSLGFFILCLLPWHSPPNHYRVVRVDHVSHGIFICPLDGEGSGCGVHGNDGAGDVIN